MTLSLWKINRHVFQCGAKQILVLPVSYFMNEWTKSCNTGHLVVPEFGIDPNFYSNSNFELPDQKLSPWKIIDIEFLEQNDKTCHFTHFLFQMGG